MPANWQKGLPENQKTRNPVNQHAVKLAFDKWPSQEAGKRYPITEMSFRQTIHGLAPSDRGFMVKIDRNERKILISFDASKVTPKHAVWLQQVERRVGLGELYPQPIGSR